MSDTPEEVHEDAPPGTIHFLVCAVHNLASKVLGERDGKVVLECGHEQPVATMASPIFAAQEGDLPPEAIAPVDPNVAPVEAAADASEGEHQGFSWGKPPEDEPVSVGSAIQAAGELGPDATWHEVVVQAKDTPEDPPKP